MRRHLFILAAALVPLSGCASHHDDTPAPNTPMVGQDGGNPASRYCVEQGGKLEIRKGPQGETGYCHLPDGRVIEEWTLFRNAQANEEDRT
ncbi:putative hemolysin [Carnimonas bestiolae]|uniref:putative hemolysin n=1 Tax=Carnimonas bestiolae TaxID=3402172 RepID=UPI003EDB9507